jgi:hypothetical protein
MIDREECLRYAKECEDMAKVARHEENRARLTDMAAAWRQLAELAEAKGRQQ